MPYRKLYHSTTSSTNWQWCSVTLYYHRNQQYSIIALTDSAGAIQERYAYSAYGELTITNASGTRLSTSAVNNRYTYTGREWDSTIAQYYFRERMYDATLGRFCSRDPIGFEGGLNLFCYVTSHLLDLMDPFAMRQCHTRIGTSVILNMLKL